jgi:hypothetical protein
MNFNQCQQSKLFQRSTGDYIGALIENRLTVYPIGKLGMLAVNTERNQLPKARLPMVLDVLDPRNTTGQTVVFSDMAGLTGEDADTARVLGILTTAWESEEHRLQNIRKVGAMAYSKWISKTVASRLGLMDYANIAKFEALLAFYFYASGRDTLTVLNAPLTVAALAEISNMDTRFITDVLATYVDQHGDNEPVTFLKVLSVASNLSPVFAQKLDPATVYKCVSGGWLGESGLFLSTLAVEYPPAFFTGLYMAFISKTGYKRTQFGTFVQKTLFTGKGASRGVVFIRQLNDILGSLSTVK